MTHAIDCSVTEYMSRDLAVGELATPLDALARSMHARNVSAIAILDGDGALAGVVSRSDLIPSAYGAETASWRLQAVAQDWFDLVALYTGAPIAVAMAVLAAASTGLLALVLRSHSPVHT
jgi:CBS domain-containing protein